MIPDKRWDEINEEYRRKKAELIEQLRRLDLWYEKEFLKASDPNSPL